MSLTLAAGLSVLLLCIAARNKTHTPAEKIIVWLAVLWALALITAGLFGSILL